MLFSNYSNICGIVFSTRFVNWQISHWNNRTPCAETETTHRDRRRQWVDSEKNTRMSNKLASVRYELSKFFMAFSFVLDVQYDLPLAMEVSMEFDMWKCWWWNIRDSIDANVSCVWSYSTSMSPNPQPCHPQTVERHRQITRSVQRCKCVWCHCFVFFFVPPLWTGVFHLGCRQQCIEQCPNKARNSC